MDLATVGVVIVTHNSAHDIVGALSCLPRARLHGVVVVDNASSDRTADLVLDLALENVVVQREENRGFGAGCNAGAHALSGAGQLLFLNPDARIQANALETLVTYLECAPRVGLVAPRIFSEDEPLTSAGDLARLITELRYVLPWQVAKHLPDRRLPTSYATSGRVGTVEGACMLVDAALFRAIGGFDERYFLFFEEHDLARRIRAVGRDVHLCAEARAQHSVGASREALPIAGRDHYFASTLRYLRNWGWPGSAQVWAATARCTWAWQRRTGRLSEESAAVLRRSFAMSRSTVHHPR